MKLDRTALILLPLLGLPQARAQDEAPQKTVVLEPGETRMHLTRNDRVLFSTSTFEDPDGQARLLVRLQAQPVYAAMAGAQGAAARKAGASQAKLVAKEQSAFRKSLSRVAGPQAKVDHAYQNTWNGFAVTLPRELAGQLKSLPGVAAVYPDRRVQAYDDASNAVIGAPQVWANPGLSGKGQVIAVIDTGIDYHHPALGGALGAEHKVIGGIDFVNDDADPMDDHGHGTHVAGIAAGSGAPKGVAPDARLLGVKVLSAGGWGSTSDIIAGIEWAVDPDRDPATDDGADVINMSLGGPGDANDPMAQAANAAMRAGVVVVTAAGNSGSGYQTVGSPGTASEVLTVGATDNQDALAWFSSRGPVLSGTGIKPELTAPGVAIDSAKPGGGTQRMSGTSMAAPHVAGAAALLREQHPGWTAPQIKSILVNSAKDLGLGVWEQGAGRLDLAQAVTQTLSLTPSTLDFGKVDLTQARWTSTQLVTVKNHGASAESYALSTRHDAPEGVSLEASPASLTLAPGEAATVAVTLSVDNARAPVPNTTLPTIGGTVQLRSAAGAIRLPIAAIHSPVLDLELGDNVWIVFVHNNADRAAWQPYPGPSASFLLPQGEYDIQVIYTNVPPNYDWAFVQREKVDLRTRTALTLSSSEAVHPFTVSQQDRRGQALPHPHFVNISLTNKTSGLGNGFLGGMPYQGLRFSPTGSGHRLSGTVFQSSPSDIYEHYFTPFSFENGISGPLTVQQPIESFREVNYQFHAPKGNRLLPLFMGTLARYDWGGFGFASGCADDKSSLHYLSWCALDNPARVTLNLAPSTAATAHIYPHLWAGNDAPEKLPRHAFYQPGLAREAEDGRLYTTRTAFDFDPFLYHPAGPLTVALGRRLPVYIGESNNGPDRIQIAHPSSPTSFFRDTMSNTVGLHAQPFRLEAPGLEPVTGTIEQHQHRYWPNFWEHGVTPGPQRLTLQAPPYWLNGREGSATVELGFDTSPERSDRNPPHIRHFQLLSGERRTEMLPLAAHNRIRFSLEDREGEFSATLEFRAEGSDTWSAQELVRTGKDFEFVLPKSMAEGYYSARLRVTDAAGNTLTQTFEPAFHVSLATDRDGDDVLDAEDAFPDDAKEFRDTDADGSGDFADADDDNDGMPDTFERLYDLDTRDPADAAQDADGDGVSNLEEYRYYTNPRDPASRPNRMPRALLGELPEQRLLTWHAVDLDLSPYFEDPDRDPLQYHVGDLPAGLRREGSRLLGHATAAALTTAFAQAFDGQAYSDVLQIPFNIGEDHAPEAIGTVPEQRVEPGREFRLDVSPYFRDADHEALAYAIDGAPAGLSIDAQGVIAGTPSPEGEFAITVGASAGLRSASQAFRLRVSSNTAPEQLSALPARTWRRGRAASFNLAPYFRDADGDALRYRASPLPPGLVLGEAGRLTGIPRSAGVFKVLVEVGDGKASIQAPWSITVRP